jgi:outer membrane protein assembly factor BamB
MKAIIWLSFISICSFLPGQTSSFQPPSASLATVPKAALPAEGKSILWTYQGNGVQSCLTYSGGFLYFIEKGELISLEASSGRKQWSYSLIDSKEPKHESLHPIRYNGPTINNNRVYISDQNYNFHAIDASSGICIWKVTLEGMFQAHTTPEITLPTFGEKRLFLGTAGVRAGRCGKVYCLREEDGKILWEHDADMAIQSSPTIIGKMLVTGGGPKKLGLNPDSGALNWKYGMFKRNIGIHGESKEWEGRLLFLTSNHIKPQFGPIGILDQFGPGGLPGSRGPFGPGGIPGSPGPQSRPGQVFGFIVCLDASTGNELWEFGSGSPGTLQVEQRSAVAPDLTSIFGITGTPRLVVVDIKTGKERFKVDNPYEWAPALYKNKMYVSSTARKSKVADCGKEAGVVIVHSLDDGAVLSKYCRPEPLIAPPTIAENSVVLLFGKENEKRTLVVATDPDTSKERWTFSLEERVVGTPVVGKEGLFLQGGNSVFCVH